MLKSSTLSWLDSLKVSGHNYRYRFDADSNDTIFCTCFALFILDLFKETEKFSEGEKQGWISYIQSFQNEKCGYFEPAKYYHTDKERNRYQLTCFCLSALGILGAEAKFQMNFLEQWKTPDDVKKYLYERDCHKGKPGSGNKAMFLAIFLTYEYERTKDSCILDKINAWFEFHNETHNKNGFWGTNLKSHYLHGLQNGLHQLVIYFYWRKEIPKFNRIIDIALMSQDRQGFFAPTPGGEACHDYDAIHILTMAHKTGNYRIDEIETCLSRAHEALKSTQNSDGGFCLSKYKMTSFIDFFRYIPFYFSGSSPYLWYYRARSCFRTFFKHDKPVYDWSDKGRGSKESNLWDTWFRCLTMAEIVRTLDSPGKADESYWRFHKTIGLGYF